MKRLTLLISISVLIVGTLNSCGIFNSYTKSVTENEFARKELKKKAFKAKFRPEMTTPIDTQNCYYSYYEIPERNSKGYFYLRLFNNGQYAYFAGHSDDIDLNDLNRANIVGYYLVENEILKLETPTGNINTNSYRIIWEFEIQNDKSLTNQKSHLQYAIKRDLNLVQIEPDW